MTECTEGNVYVQVLGGKRERYEKGIRIREDGWGS